MDSLTKSLRSRHARIDAKIAEEQARPRPDTLRISALKKLKLHFRDKIELLERAGRRRSSTPIVVVRRRGAGRSAAV